MIASVTKEFRFEAAHDLPQHNGKCKGLHGHSYKVQITCNGNVKRETNHPDEGMVVDFAQVKSLWKSVLEPILDHQYLNDQFRFATTAENIAAWITVVLKTAAPEFRVVKVNLWETETSKVTIIAGNLHSNDVTYYLVNGPRGERFLDYLAMKVSSHAGY